VKFYVSALVGVIIKVILQNARCNNKGGKGEVHPGTDYESPEREYMCSYVLSLTSARDGGGRSTPCPGCFTPKKDSIPFVEELGCTAGLVWTGAENRAPTGIRFRIV